MSYLFFQVLKNLVVRDRVSSMVGKVLKWNQSALLPTAVSQEYVHSWFDPVKMCSVLMCVRKRPHEFSMCRGCLCFTYTKAPNPF